MPVREVEIVKPDGSSSSSNDQYEIELFNYTAVFRELRFDIRFAVVSETNIPIISSAPTEIPEGSPFICLYGCPVGRDLAPVTGIFSNIKERLLSFKTAAARPDEFSNTQFLSCETVAHSTRLIACFEKDPERRAYLFQESYNIYEGLILASCHSSLIDMVRQISQTKKGSGKAILFQPIPDMGRVNSDWRRMLSHSFAGMALCSFLGFCDQRKYVSLVSASLCCEATRPLELASTLRLIPFLMCRGEYAIPWTGSNADIQATLDGIFASASVVGVYMNVTENVLIPAMLKAGRKDLFDAEIGFVAPEKRASCESFAKAIVQRAIDRETAPAPFVSVRTRIVDGKIIDRKCANCGDWDRTGKSYMRCSVCMQVYYCSKGCQVAHWKEHKTVCCKKK